MYKAQLLQPNYFIAVILARLTVYVIQDSDQATTSIVLIVFYNTFMGMKNSIPLNYNWHERHEKNSEKTFYVFFQKNLCFIVKHMSE